MYMYEIKLLGLLEGKKTGNLWEGIIFKLGIIRVEGAWFIKLGLRKV